MVSNLLSDRAKLYGILLDTDMLDTFLDLDWICHPGVSTALVVDVFQKDTQAIDEALTLLNKNIALLNTNKNKFNNIKSELKSLKKMNSSWTTQ